MTETLVAGSMLKCNFGNAPGPFQTLALPGKPQSNGVPIGVAQDTVPVVNIPVFGMCSCPANPQVASATAAAAGVLTPMPCIPVTAATPWQPAAARDTFQGIPLVTIKCKCLCQWGGEVSVTEAVKSNIIVD